MPTVSCTRTINANSDTVWVPLADYMNIDRFSPGIVRVEALTSGENGVGSRRRNVFEDGNSVVEEVTGWNAGQSMQLKLTDLQAMPLTAADAEIRLTPSGSKTTVTWTFRYRMKFGPIGWVLGQTLLKMVMKKAIKSNLEGLARTVE